MSVYEQHGIEAVGFDERAFAATWGDQLANTALSRLPEEIIALGMGRHFMQNPLSAERMREINSTEALVVAESATQFAARVQTVEIEESGERMVHLPTTALQDEHPWTFSDAPFHPACGEWAGKQRQFWVRQGLADQLVRASDRLVSAGIGLHFEDAFRPPGVQEGLFARRYGMAKAEHPEWSHADAILEAKSKTAYSARLASHKGGAAVDVRAVDLQTGKLLDIGHEYPDGGAHVALHSPLVTQRQWEARMILALTVQSEGMEMFPFEDWHACTGDNTAAACAGGELVTAIYAPVKRFDHQTGEILEVYSGTELDEVFTVDA